MVKKLRWFLLLLACGLLGGCAPLRGTVTEVRNAQCGDFKVSIAQDEKPVREAGGKGLIGFRIQVTYTGEGDIQVWHSSPLCSVALYRGGEELLPAMRQNELCTSFFRKDEPLIFWYAVPREDEVVGALERENTVWPRTCFSILTRRVHREWPVRRRPGFWWNNRKQRPAVFRLRVSVGLA